MVLNAPSTLEALEAPCAKYLLSLASKSLSVATAESCTGGLLAALLSSVPGSSKSFKGSIVSYSNEAKVNLLNVVPSDLDRWGAVSESVAESMAIGARKSLRSDWAVSITGIAGPGGGSEEKPVGIVCFGLAGPDRRSSATMIFPGDRKTVRLAAVGYALELLIETLEQDEPS